MTQNAIATWLQRKRRDGMRSAALYAAVTIAGGVFVLALMSYFIFVAVKVPLLSAFPLSPLVTPVSALIALIVGSLIFADAVGVRRDDMTFFPTWFLREYISIGPRLILEGWPHVLRVRGLASLDLENCADVLAFLATKATPAFRDEVLRRFPAVEWSRLRDELQLLPGVIFFRPDGLRVILVTPLRLELRTLLAHEQDADIAEPEPQAVPVEQPHQLTPAEILGVDPAATLAQIKTAYRTRIKECHPDRFANLDEHSRSLAEEWTKSLNAAYEFLTATARNQSQT